MKSNNKTTGHHGEDVATKYLIDHHYHILQRNFSTKFGELDIIATDKHHIIFIEVKSKIGEHFGTPEEMITTTKVNRIRKLSHLYLISPDYRQSPYFLGSDSPLRLDVIAIVFHPDLSISRLNHYQNVSR